MKINRSVFSVDADDTQVRYVNIRAASKATGIHKANICAVLRGIQKRAGGKQWYFVPEVPQSRPHQPTCTRCGNAEAYATFATGGCNVCVTDAERRQSTLGVAV